MAVEETTGRRAAPREGVLRSGKLVIGPSVVNCIVLDISEKGARVRLEVMMPLPEKLTLCLRGGAAFIAVTRWARVQEVGLEFLGPAALTARTAAQAAGMLQSVQGSGFDTTVSALKAARYFDDPALQHLADEAREAYARLGEKLAQLSRADAWEPPDVFNL